MTKHDRLAAAPIFIVDFQSVFGCDVAHFFAIIGNAARTSKDGLNRVCEPILLSFRLLGLR
jgi:hypothetical protein